MSEIVRPFRLSRKPRIAVFDFDGTLSLIRSGWVEIMVDIMIDVLRPLPGTTETDSELNEFVTDFVLRMTGCATVFQMEYFVNAAKARGGNPQSPEHYTQQFLDELGAKAEELIALLQSGQVLPDELLVPGARQFLQDLRERGVQMTLASGTPGEFVRREAQQLGIADFFEGRIYGPGSDWRAFSKLSVMRQTLDSAKAEAAEFIGFGDGFVETENVKTLGGLAVGCATDETHRSGRVEDWKRSRLIQAGADIIIPDYRNGHKLTDLLFSSKAIACA